MKKKDQAELSNTNESENPKTSSCNVSGCWCKGYTKGPGGKCNMCGHPAVDHS